MNESEKEYIKNADEFYRKLYFEQIGDQFKMLNEKVDKLGEDISVIRQRVFWMTGFATGIGFLLSFLWNYVRAKITT